MRPFRRILSLRGVTPRVETAWVLVALSAVLAACSADGGYTDQNSMTTSGGSSSAGATHAGGTGNGGMTNQPTLGGGTNQLNGGSSQGGNASAGSSQGSAGNGSAGLGQGGNQAGGSGGSGTAGASAGNDAGGSSAAGSNAGGSSNSSLPDHIVGGYYPNWTNAPPRLRDVDSHYNLIYLFAAKPVGGAPGTTGAVTFDLPDDGAGARTNFNADIAYARSTQHRKIILSVGGAGAGMSFPNRQKSQTFVDSIDALYTKFGGFDGMDWNTFEADQDPDTTEMIWISLQLKSEHPGFIISAPPAPWNDRDKTFCAAMVKAGALDYAAPQYYDGPNLATQDYMTTSVAEWAQLIGAPKLVVGFGIWNQANYMNIADAISTWKAVTLANPTLRGAFDWEIFTDIDQGSPFAKKLGPLIAP